MVITGPFRRALKKLSNAITMKKFDVPFIFSTNGHLYTEYAEDTGYIHDTLSFATFPTPPKSLKRDMKLSKACTWILNIQNLW